jgi:hypothetical protein
MTAPVPRYYQAEAEAARVRLLGARRRQPAGRHGDGHGKSIVIGSVTKRLVTQYDMRLLMLVHVRELVEQNFLALKRLWPDAPAGIYSAGLGRRDTHHRITFASIQSVYRRARSSARATRADRRGAPGPRTAARACTARCSTPCARCAPDLRVAASRPRPTAWTPGRLDDKDALFDETVYSYGIRRGIEDGFLSPLTSKRGQPRDRRLRRGPRGGEFVAGALEEAASDEAVIAGRRRRDRRPTAEPALLAGVLRRRQERHRVRDVIRSRGFSCETITGDTPPGERDALHRRLQGRAHPLPDQRQRPDDRLRRAGRGPDRHAAPDALAPGCSCRCAAAARASPRARPTAWCWTSPATSAATVPSTWSRSRPSAAKAGAGEEKVTPSTRCAPRPARSARSWRR